MDPALVEAICRYCPVFWFHPDEKYFPSSWNHLLQIGTLKVDGKVSTSLGSASDISTQLANESQGSSPLTLLGQNALRADKLLLDIGPKQGGDGYDGPPNPSNKLYGDAFNRGVAQVLTVYTLGTLTHQNGIQFVDVVYAPQFFWNGTIDDHAFDIEEVTVRFQYTPRAARGTGYDKLQDFGIVKDQGLVDIYDKWIVARVGGSAHGNMMLWPTSMPGVGTQSVEFTKDARIVFYSAKVSHAMYATAGVHKRIFGFGSDTTGRGKQWSPTIVSMFAPQGHFVYDVATRKAVPSPDPSLLMGRFCGRIGNNQNSQNLVPWKGGVTNLMSAGDFYWKFQNSNVNATRYLLSEVKLDDKKNAIMVVGAVVIGLLTAYDLGHSTHRWRQGASLMMRTILSLLLFVLWQT